MDCAVPGWSLPADFELGTLQDFDHLLLSGAAFWGQVSAPYLLWLVPCRAVPCHVVAVPWRAHGAVTP